MAELPDTRMTLLLRIRDAQDQEAWRQFVELYAPVVYGYARKRGLQEADAQDVTQEVLRGVAGAVAGLDAVARQGSFRKWLFTLAHHKVFDFRRKQRQAGQGSGDTGVQEALQQHAAPDEHETIWDEEYDRRLFTWAAEQVRPQFEDRTWQAFWQTAIEGKAAQEVGQDLEMTVGAVYLAKSRVTARLREQIQTIEGS
jgi:RNA polymerase sigma-70 factor (ECF subfamily)